MKKILFILIRIISIPFYLIVYLTIPVWFLIYIIVLTLPFASIYWLRTGKSIFANDPDDIFQTVLFWPVKLIDRLNKITRTTQIYNNNYYKI